MTGRLSLPGPRPVRRRGMAAVAMVVLMMTLGLIVAAMVLGSARDHELTVRRLETVQAFYAAESGISMSLRELMESNDEDGDGAIGTISDDGDDANNPAIGSATVLVTSDDSSGDTELTSAALAGESKREQTVTLTGSGESLPGLAAKYIDVGSSISTLAAVDWSAAATATGTATQLNIASTSAGFWSGGPTDYFAAQYTGTITIPTTGTWTFYTNSDDGSSLSIDGTEIVDNDGLHSMTEASGSVALGAGTHTIQIRFFENAGVAGLIVSYSGPGVSKTVIPAAVLSH